MNTQNLQTQSALNFTNAYLQLRQTIGWLGFLLPFILVIGVIIASNQFVVHYNISLYFFSHLHIVFVGVLCIVGILLVCYKSPIENNKLENILSSIAGFASFGVACFPTSYDGYNPKALTYISVPEISEKMSTLHFIFAAIMFACFAIMCLITFKRSDKVPTSTLDIQKKNYRNNWYKACGWGIIVSIVIIFIIYLIDDEVKKIAATYYTTIIFETTSLVFFGSSWIVKGSQYWADSKYKLFKGLQHHFRG